MSVRHVLRSQLRAQGAPEADVSCQHPSARLGSLTSCFCAGKAKRSDWQLCDSVVTCCCRIDPFSADHVSAGGSHQDTVCVLCRPLGISRAQGQHWHEVCSHSSALLKQRLDGSRGRGAGKGCPFSQNPTESEKPSFGSLPNSPSLAEKPGNRLKTAAACVTQGLTGNKSRQPHLWHGRAVCTG